MKPFVFGGLLSLAMLGPVFGEDFPAPKSLGPTESYGMALGRSMRLLEGSTAEAPNTVRVLFYGQSITEQKWTEAVAADLRRQYPHADLVIENRAIGGHSSQLLVKTAEADLYPFYPDLLIFHVYGDHRRYEDIIRRVRERTTADILLQNDHFSADQPLDEETDAAKLTPAQWAPWFNHAFLPDLARRYDAELADQRGLWKRYLTDHDLKPADLLRDNVHLNAHGEFLMGEIVKAHLRPHPDAPRNEDRVITRHVGSDVEWQDGRLALRFTGNRIEAIFDGSGGGRIDVRIDGRKPSEFPGCHVFSKVSSYGNSRWPGLLQVRRGETPLQAETWTVAISDANEDYSEFRFTLTGSVTGADGGGSASERFVSDSGRIVIEPEDWNLAYAKKVFKHPLPDDAQFTLEVLPMFADSISPEHRPETVLIAQGLPHGEHILELRGGPGSGLAALRFHNPPLMPADERR